jgi:hypothetical protein
MLERDESSINRTSSNPLRSPRSGIQSVTVPCLWSAVTCMFSRLTVSESLPFFGITVTTVWADTPLGWANRGRPVASNPAKANPAKRNCFAI